MSIQEDMMMEQFNDDYSEEFDICQNCGTYDALNDGLCQECRKNL